MSIRRGCKHIQILAHSLFFLLLMTYLNKQTNLKIYVGLHNAQKSQTDSAITFHQICLLMQLTLAVYVSVFASQSP